MLPPFTVFDVETTGLDPKRGHKIIEIAGIRVEGDQIDIDNAFVELVNPERDIPWEAKRVNKIENELVAGAPTIDLVLPRFLEFAKGSILVAHNASFDMGFLDVEKDLCWGYLDIPECLCTMRMSQALYPSDFRHNLDAVSRRFGLMLKEEEHRHRALPDVILTAQALLRMIEEKNLHDLEALRAKGGMRKMVA